MVVKQLCQRLVNKALQICEKVWLARVEPIPIQGPIFIIGPPRSGTTLLYEALVHKLALTYLTNTHAYCYAAPALITRLLSRHIEATRRPQYRSSFGTIEGKFAPSECGNFWFQWFLPGPDVYTPSGMLEESTLLSIRRIVSAIQFAGKAPIIFKTTYNSMRIGGILDVFPKACFLVCKRNPVDTAQSILRAREQLQGDVNSWLGVRPREHKTITSEKPAIQVVDQIYFIEKQIEEDCKRFGSSAFLPVYYEKFCQNPRGTVEGIERFLHERNVMVEQRDALPKSFPCSTGRKVEPETYAEIVARVRERFPEWSANTHNYAETSDA
ncbi:MAG: sulfotransferase [Pirellulales bacterium]|nr:sulfotransferase [Pirellulales bacterium]